MASVPVVGPVVRAVGYGLFLLWCGVVAVAISVVGLLRMGRMAVGLGSARR